MMKIDIDHIKQSLSSIISPSLVTLVLNCYLDMQKRYYSGDWQPAELDGGQFCEAIARAIHQFDSGLIEELLPGKISVKLLNEQVQHKIDFKDRDHFCRVLQATYKFRSDRGVAHISTKYNANLLDASLIVANVKWMFAEFLRLTLKKEPKEVVAIIEAIVQLEHPLIHELDGVPLVLSDTLTTPEEILVLIRHSSGGRLTLSELQEAMRETSANTINMAINRLADNRQVRLSRTKDVVITPLGEERVREKIMPKLPPHIGTSND